MTERYFVRSLAVLAAVALTGCQSALINPPLAGGPDYQAPYGMYYALPRGLVTVTVKSETDAAKLAAGQLYSLEVSAPQFEPDPAHYYRINVAWDIGSDDQIVVETTEQGILKSIATTSKDQTVEIVKRLIELASTVSQIGVGTPSGLEVVPEQVPIQVQHRLDLADPVQRQAFNDALAAAKAEAEILVEAPALSDAALGVGDDLKRNRAGCTAGICFRPLIPYTVVLQSRAAKGKPTVVYQRATSLLPNGAPVLSVGLTRASFVEKTANYTFAASGIPTKADVKKPSEAVGFVSIPVAVAKAIVSIPSDLLTLRIKRTTDETTYLNSLKGLLEAQQKYLEAIRATQPKDSP